MARLGGKTYMFFGLVVFLASLFIDWKKLMIFGVIGLVMFFIGLARSGGGRKAKEPRQRPHPSQGFQPKQQFQHPRQQLQQRQQSRFCPQCGNHTKPQDRFCSICGNKLF